MASIPRKFHPPYVYFRLNQVDVNTLKALKVSLFSDRDAQAAKNEDPQSADAGNTDEVHHVENRDPMGKGVWHLRYDDFC